MEWLEITLFPLKGTGFCPQALRRNGLDCYDLPCSILPSFSPQLIGSGAAPEQLIQAGELSLSESPFYLQEVRIREWVFEVKAKYWGWQKSLGFPIPSYRKAQMKFLANPIEWKLELMPGQIQATRKSEMVVGVGVRWAAEAE